MDTSAGKTILSKQKGMILFGILVVILTVLFIFATKGTVNKTSATASQTNQSQSQTDQGSNDQPSAEPTQLVTPTPTPTYPVDETAIDNNAAAEKAIIIATKLSARDWNDDASIMLSKIQNYVSSDYFPTVAKKVNKFDLGGCVKTHCIVSATKGLTKLNSKSSGELDVTQVIIRYSHYTKPMPSLTWHIHMQLESDGQWYATSIKGPNF